MTVEKILSAARNEIGTKESPSGSNRVKYNTAYYGREVSGSSYPWCCVFIWWLYKSAGKEELFCGGKKTAYCPTAEAYYKKAGLLREEPAVGDIVFYDFDGSGTAAHIGIVESVNKDGSITAIEGNTSLTSDDNGGAVMRRRREKKCIRSFARPCYEEEGIKEPAKIYSVNDILWQLMHDGIVTEADKWKVKMQEDTDVYWLCYETANKLRGTL